MSNTTASLLSEQLLHLLVDFFEVGSASFDHEFHEFLPSTLVFLSEVGIPDDGVGTLDVQQLVVEMVDEGVRTAGVFPVFYIPTTYDLKDLLLVEDLWSCWGV